MSRRHQTYIILVSLSFILGCTLTLLCLRTTTLKLSVDSPQVPSYKLLVLIMSSMKNYDRRTTIRETWGSVGSRKDVKIIFVLSLNQDLTAEKLAHDDIVEVDTPDIYQMLSHKLLKSFNSVRDVNFEYLLKCDDDSFANIDRIVDELEHKPADRFYWGYFIGKANVHKEGKWKETNWIMCDFYLPYALGGGYVLSKDLVTFIVNNQHYISVFVSEDISVGLWLAPLNITRQHDRRFDTLYLSRGCHNDYLVTHKHSPQTMRQYWSQIVKTKKMCKQEYQRYTSYEYNWKVKPSQCCVNNKSLFP